VLKRCLWCCIIVCKLYKICHMPRHTTHFVQSVTLECRSHKLLSRDVICHDIAWQQLVGAMLESDPRNESTPKRAFVSSWRALSRMRSKILSAHQLDTAPRTYRTQFAMLLTNDALQLRLINHGADNSATNEARPWSTSAAVSLTYLLIICW